MTETESQSDNSSEVQAATPKEGGKVRFAHDVHGPEDTTDPALFNTSLDHVRGRCHYNGLLQFNEDLTMRPELAEEFEVNDDATEYTFKLRKNVEWHDGKKFDADDVVYTMNRHLGEDSHSVANALVSDVQEWKKVDSHTVKAVLSIPNRDLPQILGTLNFKVVQNGADDEYFKKPIGTGPFVCMEFAKEGRAISVRNENYWRDPAHLEEIETFAITNADERVKALVSGEVDLIGAVDPKQFDVLEDSPIAERYSVAGGAFFDIVTMQDRHPGDNHDFVMALKYLQRRDHIVEKFLKGEGAIGNDHPVSPQYGHYCEDMPIREYDPDKAKFHWQKSGIDGGNLPPLMFADTDPGVIETCELLGEEANKIGMPLPTEIAPVDGYWDLISMRKPLHAGGWCSLPTANTIMSYVYDSKSTLCESQWTNERFDKLLSAARAEADPVKERDMYRELQMMIRDDGGTIIPCFRNYVDGKLTKVKGVPRVPLGPLGGNEWPEYAWLDDA